MNWPRNPRLPGEVVRREGLARLSDAHRRVNRMVALSSADRYRRLYDKVRLDARRSVPQKTTDKGLVWLDLHLAGHRPIALLRDSLESRERSARDICRNQRLHLLVTGPSSGAAHHNRHDRATASLDRSHNVES